MAVEIDGGVQRLLRHLWIGGLQNPRGGGQPRRRAQFAVGIVLGEHPAVVGRSRRGGGLFAGLEHGVVVQPVRLGRDVAQQRILRQGRLDNAAIGPAHRLVPAQHAEQAVLDLLDRVVDAVGPVDVGLLLRLVDGGGVVVQPELLDHLGQQPHRAHLALDAQIVVARVVPAAGGQPRHAVARLVLGQRVRSLFIAVEMVADLRHARVVLVVEAVPGAVILLDQHVTHLHRQEIVQSRLPDAAIVHVVADAEHMRHLPAIAEFIDAGVFHRAQVRGQIVVAQELPPRLRREAGHLKRAIAGQLVEDQRIGLVVALVLLDHHGLGLTGAIADLRNLHHRRGPPVRIDVRRDDPRHGVLRRAGPGDLAHDVPAVVHVAAPVQQLQLAGLAFDLQPLQVAFRRDHQGLALGHRRGDQLIVVVAHRAVRLTRKGSALRIHQPRLAEQIGREQLEIEADLAFPVGGQRLVEIDRDLERIAVHRRHRDMVGEVEVRVVDRIEALTVLRLVRVMQGLGHGPGGGVHHGLAVARRHGRPLTRRRLKPQIAVRRHARAVLDHGHAGLVAVGIDIGEDGDVQARRLEIALVVELELRLGLRRARHDQQACRHQKRASHPCILPNGPFARPCCNPLQKLAAPSAGRKPQIDFCGAASNIAP